MNEWNSDSFYVLFHSSYWYSIPFHRFSFANIGSGSSAWVVVAVAVPCAIIALAAGVGIGAAAMRRKYLQEADGDSGDE